MVMSVGDPVERRTGVEGDAREQVTYIRTRAIFGAETMRSISYRDIRQCCVLLRYGGQQYTLPLRIKTAVGKFRARPTAGHDNQIWPAIQHASQSRLNNGLYLRIAPLIRLDD